MPLWKREDIYDSIFFVSVGGLANVKLFKGDMIFTHSCRFLVELSRRTFLFSEMDSWFDTKPGKNSKHFLKLCCPQFQRTQCSQQVTFKDVTEKVNDELDTQYEEQPVNREEIMLQQPRYLVSHMSACKSLLAVTSTHYVLAATIAR